MKRVVMRSPVMAAVLLSACASTGTLGVAPHSSERARVAFEPAAGAPTTQLVPRAREPRLPSADRLANAIVAELGREPSVAVRLCVSPQGRVVEAKLERKSA